jgi:HTH-type transcriptional regulator/antitoxin HigA
MPRHNHLLPAIPTHPGEILKEALAEQDITQKELADKMGRPIQLISGIINGHKSITADTALDLAEALGTSPELWINLESHYKLTVARLKRDMQQKAS